MLVTTSSMTVAATTVETNYMLAQDCISVKGGTLTKCQLVMFV